MLRARVLMAGCAIACVATTAIAEDDAGGRVGRLAQVQGVVQHAPADDPPLWSDAGLNDPVAQGDNLWVERDGRAEVDYGGGQFRLAGDTSVHVSRLDERQLALFIASGRVIVRVRVLESDDSVRVDTPAAQIQLVRPGLYRIDIAADSPQTTVVVREGEAQVAMSTATQRVLPGQSVVVSGVDGEQADVRTAGGIDGFDGWSAARDRIYEAPRQHAYVSRQMVGQADLDAYGSWQTYADYGAVWFPAGVEPEWAPYRFGHWTWVSGWGYAWVDRAPWGYAPFHYGRWAHIDGRWGWCPGTFVARPAWAPALVAWYGGSGATTVRGRGPVYGWVPLGWREPLVPWWMRCGDHCWARYNRPYGISAADRDRTRGHYANARVPGGITAVSGAALTSGRPVAINRVPIASDAAFTPALAPSPPATRPDDAARVGPRAAPAAPAPVPASTLATRMYAGSGSRPAPPAGVRSATGTLPVPAERGLPSTLPAQRTTPVAPLPGAAPALRERVTPAPALPVHVVPAPSMAPGVPSTPAVLPRVVPPATGSRAPAAGGPAVSPIAPVAPVPQVVAPAPSQRPTVRAAPPNPGLADRAN
jgi:hypothetical protein